MRTFLLRSTHSVVVNMNALGLVMFALACSGEPALRDADHQAPPSDGVSDDAGERGEGDKDSETALPDSSGREGDAGDDQTDDADIEGDSAGDGDTADDAERPGDASTDAPMSDAGDGDAALGDAGPPDAGGSLPKPARERMWGVTVDDIQGLSAIRESLERLAKKPTARIVFDEYMPATYYANAVKRIGEVSFVMGELLDSWYVAEYSVSEYDKRTAEYLDRLGSDVDIWEVGNEINGEWLCDKKTSRCTEQQRRDVVKKMTGSYDRVKARGAKAAVTLYYNRGCYSQAAHEMFTWTRDQVPERMKAGLDYVFVSYYEDDCKGPKPNWEEVFTELGEIFPNAELGFGECGTKDAAKKAEYINRYYRMEINAPRYIGGYFWWYFRRDMVPHTNPLWGVLNQAIVDG